MITAPSGAMFLAAIAASAILMAAEAQSVPEAQGKPTGVAPPPLADARPVVESIQDTTLVDPFRWLEDTKQPEVTAWWKAQNDYARSVLGQLPLRGEILAELDSLRGLRGDFVDNIQRVGSSYYYHKRVAGERWLKLYRRPVGSDSEQVILSAEQLVVEGKPYSIESYVVSPDEAYVAWQSRDATRAGIRMGVVEVASGRILDEAPMAQPVAWAPDGRHLFIRQITNLGAPVNRLFDCPRLVMHEVGSTRPDTPLFGCGVFPDITVEPTLSPGIALSPACNFAVIGGWRGTSAPRRYYFAPRQDVLDGRPNWQVLADTLELVQAVHCRGSDVYLRTSRPSSKFKIVHRRLDGPYRDRVDTLATPADAVIDESVAARDGLYVSLMVGGVSRLLRFPWGSTEPESVQLPFDGSLVALTANQLIDGATFFLSGWTTAPAHYVVDPRTGEVRNTGLLPPSGVDWSGIEVRSVMVRSHDGTMVPLIILHPGGIKLDGRNPTVLNGYGAFGAPVKPFVHPDLLPWLKRGGVWAYPLVRGGGEFGEEWHHAGQKLNKPNSWKDLIACAEYLVREGFTSPERMGLEGSSAGGLLAARSVTERADLFGGAVILYGLLNSVRLDAMANSGVISEFGSATTAEGFRALLGMDSYHHVRDGVKYPPLLFMHGTADLNVEPWQSYKMVARLQGAGMPPAHALLRVSENHGHGFGGREGLEARADALAFLLEKLRH